LQLLQWKTPAHHWNLKNPPDLFAVEEVYAVFPDARLIWSHRDPADALSSVCSLTGTIRVSSGETIDKPALGAMQLGFQSEGVRRAMNARKKIGDEHFVDVTQSELGRDMIGTIERVCQQLQLPFTDDYRAHLVARLANRPRGEHGAHLYTLEEFGLKSTEIHHAFSAYMNRFAIPAEV
jgi:hypothetical protein